ncbi:MAG: 23S rRNA (adenine(2503)-C(2))-methyltransferase RlmN [Bacteroidales bacterium]|nr:23S rRNA (adenine(2503)-C(2))-methyltransferase RlmN [Bacteroidales bacterium]
MEKEILFGKTLTELQEICRKHNLPSFASKQIAEWLYKKEISEIDEMTNISLKNREILKSFFTLGITPPTKFQESIDGTKKYLFATKANKFIEAAYIPESDRATLCVSSQIGCKMGCLFCMTGKQGFQGNLTAGEILNQVKALPERDKLTNIVYMGMGEPLDNTVEVLKSLEIFTSEWGFGMSPKRITVSTIGIIPSLELFLNQSDCHLAISLHTPFDEERKKLMPVQNIYPIENVIGFVKQFDWNRQRRISIEYIMFKGINDTSRHVNQLASLLNGLKCRINLIRFHPIPGTPLESTDTPDIIVFRDKLNAKGITATIRRSRGEDIYAACGLLSTKELIKKESGDY